MSTDPRADWNRPESRRQHPLSRPPVEQPIRHVPEHTARGQAPSSPAPPLPAAPASARRHSLRQLLVGQRSVVFIMVMLSRMAWLVVQGIRNHQDLRFAAAGAGIYLMALLIASPARRLRSLAVGIMCSLIWSYAFVDSSQLGTPALTSWPAVFPIGVMAVLVETIFTDVVRAQRGRFGGQAGRLAAGIPRPAMLLQAFGVVLFIVPVVVMCIEGTLAYGFDSEPLQDLVLVSISLPPLIGALVYVSFVLRRLRGLAPLTVRA